MANRLALEWRVERRKLIFAVAAMALSAVFAGTLVLAVDVYFHRKYENVAGLNIWGYRGRTVGEKQPGEQRVVVLGGSTAFGYGVTPDESMTASLERQLNNRRGDGGEVSVVNLAYNNEGAYSFIFTLQDYEYLDYDIVLLYTGYNDLGRENTQVYRHESPVFRLTGYSLIFPLIFREKALTLRYGDVEAGYRAGSPGEQTTFKPNLAAQATSSALDAATQISSALERQLGRLTDEPAPLIPTPSAEGCGEWWRHYCQGLDDAVSYVLASERHVFVVTQPYISDEHVEQQRLVAGMLAERFGDEPLFHFVGLGSVIDLEDRTLAPDGMHLSALGNEQIAQELVPHLLSALQ
ncbi:MAG: SGNH/GDSL hydrolase family protein [Vicinamibacterales bacterium]|nr:SGNH/GDSL hydrolase family protein [Vicinamibacterales bacterium]HJO39521.1 SGNH/GDSL hydrolase family protein [Vicinamibacterales bacterium]